MELCSNTVHFDEGDFTKHSIFHFVACTIVCLSQTVLPGSWLGHSTDPWRRRERQDKTNTETNDAIDNID